MYPPKPVETNVAAFVSGIVILQVDASNLALLPDRNIIPPENGNIVLLEGQRIIN